jgi:DNA polymerase
VHPSALLRAPDEETRRREIERFIEDLRQVAAILK